MLRGCFIYLCVQLLVIISYTSYKIFLLDMDTISWIDLPIGHPEYVAGCMQFIEFAKEGVLEGKILCPCKFCKVEK